ncbi:MAG: SusC/RagA family TonB-linked outer membrane protein [Bacteroidales bacterium]|nr:SusC/RagA family TonB-linked outer membrane protein [Bacteroidales bacterium]
MNRNNPNFMLWITMLCMLQLSLSAQHTVTGTVVDHVTGETLPFVTVILKETPVGTVTSNSGVFSITVPNAESVLVFSFMGYETMELRADLSRPMSVRMQLSTATLEGVVVTGYQIMSRERSAGAFNMVSGENVANRISAKGSVVEGLEGLITGLSINHGSDEQKLLIRGANSVLTTLQPLFVVDGVPMSAPNVELMVNENDIASITVLRDATAASIWGAQAANGVIVITTKQGRDTDRKFSVNYNGIATFRGRPDYDYLNYMSSEQFIRTAREIFDPVTFNDVLNRNFGLASDMYPIVLPHEKPMYQWYNGEISESEMNKTLTDLASLNNRSQIGTYFMQPEFSTRHSVSFTTGSSDYSTYGSFMYEHNQGVSLTNRNRYAINLRQDFNPRPWLRLDLTANFVQTTDNNGLLPENDYGDRFLPQSASMNRLLPYMMFKDQNGNHLSHASLRYQESLMHYAEELSGVNLDYVPLDELRYGFDKGSSFNARVNGGINIKLIEGLNFEGRYQYQRNSGLSEEFRDNKSYGTRFEVVRFTTIDPYFGLPEHHLPETGGRYRGLVSNEKHWTVRNQFLFDRTFDNYKHQLTALAGMEMRADNLMVSTNNLRGYNPQGLFYVSYDERMLSTYGVEGILLLPGSMPLSMLSGSSQDKMYSISEIETRFVSFYSNAAYTYLDKYSFNGSIRVDQSNLFGSDPSVQFKPIWSTGVAWTMGNEDFMKEIRIINHLNLRLSYGLGGNSPDPGMGGSYDLIYGFPNPSFPNVVYTIMTPANHKLVWEKTQTLNFGLDVAMFDRRISANLDIYHKKTTDLLGYVELNQATGWGSVLGNLGELTNKGFELSVNTKNIRTKEFSWHTALMLTYNKNKVVEFYDQMAVTPSNKVDQRYLPGYSAFSIFAYQWAGLDHLGDPQIYDYQNNQKVKVKQTGQIQSMDAAVYMGSSQPLWYGGLTNTLTYQNFELSFLFVYNLGHKMRTPRMEFSSGRMYQNIDADFAKRWQQIGDETHTNIPSYVANPDFSEARRSISFYNDADVNVVSASYIKLRDVSLSYTLPQNICDKAYVESARVRLQAGNLFYWAANKNGIDPEAYNYRYGIRETRFGPSFSIGLSVSFK